MKRRIVPLLGLTLCCLSLLLFNGGEAFAQTTHATHALSPKAPMFSSPWPDQSGCWDTHAFVWQPPTYGTYEGHTIRLALWASPDCGTNWADLQVLDGTQLPMKAQVCARPSSAPTTGIAIPCAESNPPLYLGRVWSKMIYSPIDPAQATGWIFGDGNGYGFGARFITGWH